MVGRSRGSAWTRMVIAIACLGVGGTAFYFFAFPQADRTRMTTDMLSNVQQMTQEDLPVHVVTLPSFGGVAAPELRNSSPKEFALRVTVRRPSSSEQHEWLIKLQPNQTLPLGRQGGWTFAGGDELELVQDGYRPRKVRLQ